MIKKNSKVVSYFSALILGSAVLASQYTFAMSPERRAGIQVLVEDAIFSAATNGITVGIRLAAEKVRPGSARKLVPGEHDQASEWQHFGQSLSPLLPGLYSSSGPLQLVDNVVPSFRYTGNSSGMTVARDAATAYATTPNARTWAPEILVSLSEASFISGNAQGLSDEDIVRSCAHAVWSWILQRENQYRTSITRKLTWSIWPLSKGDYNPDDLIGMLESATRTPQYQRTIPEFQGFYQRSLAKVRQELGR